MKAGKIRIGGQLSLEQPVTCPGVPPNSPPA
jgi:hypothetical protein